MAVVKLGNKVKTNLPDTIRYVINPEKNDGGRLVYASYSSERHDANTLAEPMIRDLERCANGLRKDGVLALHLKHSFSPDEHVSAEQVHELGVMLTEAITGGDYKYVVSTHMDRHHLHNHIVICAANRRTGRKMRLTRRSIDRWRAVSDELCRREGLAVLENPKVETAVEHDEMLKAMRHAPDQSSGRQFGVESPVIASTGVGADMGELYAAARGVGVKERLRILIDLDAARANSIGELAELLDSHGVGLTLHGGGVTFMDRATGRRFRGARLGGVFARRTRHAALGRWKHAASDVQQPSRGRRERSFRKRVAARNQTAEEGQSAREHAAPRWQHMASTHARNVHRHAHGPVEQVRGPFRHRHAVGGVRPPEAARRIVGRRRFHDAQTLCGESRAVPLLPSAGKETRRAEDDGRGVERGVQTPARERWRPGQGTA